MKIEIKKILTEDFDLSQPYVASFTPETDFSDRDQNYTKSVGAYMDTLNRGLTAGERAGLANNINDDFSYQIDTKQMNPVDSTAKFIGHVPDEKMIMYHMIKQNSDAYDKLNYENRDLNKLAYDREGELRHEVYSGREALANAQHQGKINTGIGAAGGLAAGVGGMALANRLRNRGQR